MSTHIYVDGACSGNPGPGGWAVVINLTNGIKTISGFMKVADSYMMEVKAVFAAYKEIRKLYNEYGINSFIIFTDAQAIVSTINKRLPYKWAMQGWKKRYSHEKVKHIDLWKQILNIETFAQLSGINISIQHVKGHNGNTFNELADKLAKNEIKKYNENLQSKKEVNKY